MKFVIGFLLCFGLVQCWAETEVKPIPTGNDRVVQGSPAVNGQFPHMVWYGGCGGSLIADKWVLTAAHCVNAARKEVRMGHVKFSQSPIVRRVVRSYIHPDYSPTLRHDIGLLELDSPVPFSDNVKPIYIPRQLTDSYTGKTAQLSGFGAVNNNGQLPDVLQFADLLVIPHEDCRNINPEIVINSTLCASGTRSPAQGGCFGDSGSALVFKRLGLNFVIGVASFIWGGCESSYPTGFVRPYYYLDWIRQVTKLEL